MWPQLTDSGVSEQRPRPRAVISHVWGDEFRCEIANSFINNHLELLPTRTDGAARFRDTIRQQNR